VSDLDKPAWEAPHLDRLPEHALRMLDAAVPNPEALALRAALDRIDMRAQCGLCYVTVGCVRESLKDIRDEVADALHQARPAR
jgi:hypothetical protein